MPVMKTYAVALDMYKTSSDTFEVVEGDTANLIVMTLKDRGNPVDLTGCKVVVSFTRGGIPAEQDTDGHGVTISGEHNNIITLDLYSSSYVSGSNVAEVQVWSGEDYKRLATSAWFNFKARRARVNANTLLSVPQFPLLSSMLATLNNIVRGVQAKWSTTDTEDPSFIQDKPVIGTDIQTPTNALTVDYTPAGTDELPGYRPTVGHRKFTLTSVLGYIRTQLDTYFAPLTHASRHATGGADAIPADETPTEDSNNLILSKAVYTALQTLTTAIASKADLVDGALNASQARTVIVNRASNFTLSEAEAGKTAVVSSTGQTTITIPADNTINFPNGTMFTVLREGSGAVVIAKDASVNWIVDKGVTSISSQGAYAVIMKLRAFVWSISCG